MNKKNIKPLIMSSLAALSLGSLSVAGTFALFTDNAETTINIGSGKVIVGNAMTIQSVSSFGGAKDSNTIESGNKVAHYANGGQINVNDTANETGTITIARWTPGDRAVFRTAPTNGSDVSIKVRLKVVISGELAPALVMKVFKVGESNPTCAATGERTLVTNWAEVAPGDNLTAFDLDIAFPDHDNGQILFGADNKDNKYQNKGAVIKVSYEAVQANADVDSYLLEKINTKLATEEVLDGGKNLNMYEAMGELTEIASIADIKSHNYVWGADEDLFYEEAGIAAGKEYKYFKVYDSMPTAQSYSIYAAAAANWSGANVSLSGIGFDAGDAEGITSVSYSGLGQESARSNIIRTNSSGTNLTVNAPYDTIYHYGTAGSVDIIAAASNSYHENGSVAFMEVAKGRIVLENNSDVEQIHISTKVTNVDENGDKTKQANVFDEIKIAYAEHVEVLPVFSRDKVVIAEEGTLVVELQKVEAEEVKSNEFVWLYQQGLKEQIRVTEEKEVTAEQLAAAPKSTDSAKVEEKTATAAEQIANNLLGEATYEELVGQGKVDQSTGAVIENYVEALVEESGLTADDLKDVKEEKVTEAVQQECKHEHVSTRAHNDYWKREGEKLVFMSDYYCDDCGKKVAKKHDMADNWSNTENHIVPFVVDNLNAAEVMGEETANEYLSMYSDKVFEDIPWLPTPSEHPLQIPFSAVDYCAFFDSGRGAKTASSEHYYVVQYNGVPLDLSGLYQRPDKIGEDKIDWSKVTLLSADKNDQYALSFTALQNLFGDDAADFYLSFNFDLDADLVRLCGSYNDMFYNVDPTSCNVEKFYAGQKQPFFSQLGFFYPLYSGLLQMQFLCGLYVDVQATFARYGTTPEGIAYLKNILDTGYVTLGLCMYDNYSDYLGGNPETLFTTFELTVSMKQIVGQEVVSLLDSIVLD